MLRFIQSKTLGCANLDLKDSFCLPPFQNFRQVSLASLLTLFFLFTNPGVHAALWVTGYYPGWEQADMPASTIDFSALTHIIHFSVVPNSDGTLDSNANSITPANSTDIVT